MIIEGFFTKVCAVSQTRLAGWCSLLLLAGALLLARGQAQPTPAPLPDGPIIGPTATPAPLTATPAGATGADSNPPGINPLTGLPLADPAVLARRPILVKVSNSPALVRPQAGIGAADLVFEHYTEAGVTRFSALFYSTLPPRVGSIRSARLIDYELAPMYQALLAFAGGSIGVEKRIFGSAAVTEVLCADREDRARCAVEAEVIAPSGLVPPSEFADRAYKGVFYGPPYYFRDEQIPVPHNLFVNLPALADLAARQGQQQAVDLRGLAFAPAAPAGAEGAGLMLEVRYRTTLVEWHYHPADGLYYRSSDRQPHYDAASAAQVRAANVVVLYAGHYLTDIVESGSGENVHYSAQITLWPAGDMLLFRDGRQYRGRWLRPTRPDALSFTTVDGQTLHLKPGQTWIQVVPLPEQMDDAVEGVRWF